MMKRKKIKLKLRKNQCQSCPFRRENEHILSAYRWAEIYSYLLGGTQHICHSTSEHVCRGGRDWQLNVWCSMGIISEPNDATLHEAMRAAGVEPEIIEKEDL
ncbi:hypothetical protein BZZ01_04490 [Nostocales cyanobacterium HT-58-2]|nr:hypothetical protein BZZ01_04490 [Nostocales cyanobacterium HT-58-2]